jgi:hypothetical protein
VTNESTSGVQRRFRVNPWAAAVHEDIGDWLAELGAEYCACRVCDDGTRELSWTFRQSGHYDGRGRRHRQLIFRALRGGRGQWEIVYTEEAASWRPGVDLLCYDEASIHAERADLRTATQRLLHAGLAHRRRPRETMLATDNRRAVLVGMVIGLVFGTGAAVWAGIVGQSLLMWLLICALPMLLIGVIFLAFVLALGLPLALR